VGHETYSYICMYISATAHMLTKWLS